MDYEKEYFTRSYVVGHNNGHDKNSNLMPLFLVKGKEHKYSAEIAKARVYPLAHLAWKAAGEENAYLRSIGHHLAGNVMVMGISTWRLADGQ